jgi:mitochondrial fission protein ELM1
MDLEIQESETPERPMTAVVAAALSGAAHQEARESKRRRVSEIMLPECAMSFLIAASETRMDAIKPTMRAKVRHSPALGHESNISEEEHRAES